MKSTYMSAEKSEKGTALILVLSVSAAIAILVASMMELSSQSWINSDRTQYVSEAMLVAQSELDCMFCEWSNAMILRNPVVGTLANVKTSRSDLWTPVGGAGEPDWEDVHTPIENMSPGLPWRIPYLPAHANGYRVLRSMEVVQFGQDDDGEPVYEMNGTVGGTDMGKVRFFVARVTVTPVAENGGSWSSSDIRGGKPIYVQMGRRFSHGAVSPWNTVGNYTSRMELSAGGTMTISGNISGNGDIYLATTGVLNILGKVRYGHMVNDTPDADPNFVPPAGYEDYNPDGDGRVNYDNYFGGASRLDPNWNPSGAYPNADLAREAKVEKLTRAKEVTGLNPQRLFDKYGPPNAPGNGNPKIFDTVNDARRLVVAPPAAGDPAEIAPYRMYNRAGIRITVNSVGAPTIVSVDPATGATTTVSMPGVISGTPRKSVYDRREDEVVKITTIDVGVLKDTINANPTLKANFNGILYVYDNTTEGGEITGAIRLINGESTPGADSPGQQNGTGFTVASNNPLYVQGDFNTTEVNGSVNRVSLIADAVTALSGAWVDENSTEDGSLDDRVASNPTGADPAVTTVNAGILTGNTPSNESGTEFSGGLQNLIRYLENWQGNTFQYSGSLGQIFESKYHTAGLTGSSFGDVYLNPAERTLTWDSELASRPPKGSLESSTFTPGDLFVFTR